MPATPSIMPVPRAARPFFQRVDSLRILGAIAIANYHFHNLPVHGVELFSEEPWDNVGAWQNVLRSICVAFNPAHAALMMFFVISGFVLRLALEHGPQSLGGATAKFLISRFFRIFPIVTVAAVAAIASMNGMIGEPNPRPATIQDYIAHAMLIDVSADKSFWALRVEVLMIPMILSLYFLERRWGPWPLAAIAVVASPLSFWGQWALWRPLSHNAFAFFLGMTIPTLGKTFVRRLSQRGALLWALAALAALFLTGPCLGVYNRFGALIEGYAATVLLSMTAYRSDLALLSFLDAKLLQRAGLAAGSYYLLHPRTFSVSIAIADRFVPLAWSTEAPVMVGLLVASLWLAALVPLALAAYYLIEAPGMWIGRQIAKKLGLSSPQPPANTVTPTQRRAA